MDGAISAGAPPLWVRYGSCSSNVYHFVPYCKINSGALSLSRALSLAFGSLTEWEIPADRSG